MSKNDKKLETILENMTKHVWMYRGAVRDDNLIEEKEYENALRIDWEEFLKLKHKSKWTWLMNWFGSGIYRGIMDGDFDVLMEIYVDMSK